MSTTKATLGSLLGAVTGSANSIISTLDVLNTGIAKAQLYANDSLYQQRKASITANAVYVEELTRKSAKDEVMSAIDIKNFTDTSPEHAALYEASYKRFTALLTEPK